MVTMISRFMDGSASLTLAELERDWPTMAGHERLDYCQSCGWLHEQTDFPDMLRFVMKRGGQEELSAIASSIAARLPQEEAFDFLAGVLQTAELSPASNIGQAIGLTKHPDAQNTLRSHLQSVWARESLWDDDKFLNWVAYDATTCIAHLLDLGASPGDFQEQVGKLSQHACSGNRHSCRNFLSKHYSWLR